MWVHGKPLTVDMAETHEHVSAFEVGCLTLDAPTAGPAGPGGTTHFVAGWEPVCGSDRVRFIFPGRGEEIGANCPDCVQAVAVPRQRTPSKSAATRTTTRAAGTTRARKAS